jgi:hypothetical protein
MCISHASLINPTSKQSKTKTNPTPLAKSHTVNNNPAQQNSKSNRQAAQSSPTSAVQSFLINNSSSSSVLEITSPFSLARCSRQIKQKLVEMSSMTGFG